MKLSSFKLMNFLAHAYLSGDNPKVLVGNFIGDFVKGKKFENFDRDIQKGILLHRHIDEYTDNHPLVHTSKKLLWNKYRHYSGVLVDVFYDHFLAKNWKQYHEKPLTEFSTYCYTTVQSFDSILPKGMKYMLPYMIKGNWLLNYSKIEGIQRTLMGMSRRTTFRSKMEEGTQELERFYEEFQEDFTGFFPDLIEFSEGWRKENHI